MQKVKERSLRKGESNVWYNNLNCIKYQVIGTGIVPLEAETETVPRLLMASFLTHSIDFIDSIFHLKMEFDSWTWFELFCWISIHLEWMERIQRASKRRNFFFLSNANRMNNCIFCSASLCQTWYAYNIYILLHVHGHGNGIKVNEWMKKRRKKSN